MKVNTHISKVVLRNFKSVVNEKVDLGRLTLLTGENSSGKSSILQVLRLLQQSLLFESEDRFGKPRWFPLEYEGARFPLNGDFIRMGFIEDIRKDSTEDIVTFGVEIALSSEKSEDNSVTPIYWGIDIGKSVKNEPNFTYIQGLNMKFYDSKQMDDNKQPVMDDNEQPVSELTVINRRDKSETIPIYYYSDYYYDSDLRYGMLMGPTGCEADMAIRGTISSKSSSKRVSGVILDGSLLSSFLPSITVKKSAKKVLAEEWLYEAIRTTENENYKEENNRVTFKENKKRDKDKLISEEDLVKCATDHITQLLRKLEKEHRLDLNLDPSSFRGKIDLLQEDLLKKVNNPRKRKDIVNKIAGNLNSIIGSRQIDVFESNFYRSYRKNIGKIRTVISSIRYLGPLRQEPQFVMLTPRLSKGDIGSKGEFIAAVLRSYGKLKRKVPLPDNSVGYVRLDDAITRWFKHLELGKKIEVIDHGVYGTSIRVEPYGTTVLLPLTFVGVGVSQVLPVLVVCLLATNSIILLEQPELHLHPAMQLRLADFFIAISRFTDNQLIVETHSEYIISRLRRRIVEEEGDGDLMNLVKVIFAKRENGATKYMPIQFTPDGDIEGLTPDGDIEEEPEGFFDQAVEEEREIFRLAIEKATEKRV